MIRLSPHTMLVTAFYFLAWATQVSTPSHSDVTIRTFNVIPRVYPMLTISDPAPTHSQFVGIHHCDKPRVYEAWAASAVGFVNYVGGYVSVGKSVGPYLVRVSHYVHRVADMLGRPTPDSVVGLVVLPTTGKLAAPPLGWARVETTSPFVVSPLPPPTSTLPLYIPPTPESGPWNPPTPPAVHSRPRLAEPVDFKFGRLCLGIAELVINADWDDWLQQIFIVSSLALINTTFFSSLLMVLTPVVCFEHQVTENDGIAFGCDTISSVNVVPLTTEPSTIPAILNSSIEQIIERHHNRRDLSFNTLATAFSGPPVDEISSRTLSVTIRYDRSLMYTPGFNSMFAPSSLIEMFGPASLRRLGVLHQRLRFNHALHSINQIISPLTPAQRLPSSIGRLNPVAERAEISTSLALAPIPSNITMHVHDIPTMLNHIFDSLIQTCSKGHHFQKAGPSFDRHVLSVIERRIIQSTSARTLTARYPPHIESFTRSLPRTLVLRTPTSTELIPVSSKLVPRFTFHVDSYETSRRVATQYPLAATSDVYDHEVATKRHTPLLIEWYPEKRVKVILSSTAADSSPLVVPRLTAKHAYNPPTTQRPPHLLPVLNSPSDARAIDIPTSDHTTSSSARLLIACHTPQQVVLSSKEEVDATKLEPPSPTSVSSIQPNSPSKSTTSLRIPPSFYRYANVRLEDLEGYPPEERNQILRREIQVAEDRSRHAKPRRDRERFSRRLTRSDIERKGERPLVRRKCEEEAEETKEMEKAMRARHLGKEEVFEGVGGPPPPTPEWLLKWLDMVKSDSMKKDEKEIKGIMKKVGEVKVKGKKPKAVRWMDEIGRRLAY